jgi:hypothetical protein
MLHLDPVPAAIVQLALAALWLAAGLHKLKSPQQFALALTAYALLPEALVSAASWVLPLVELALAGGLLVASSRPYAACASAALLALYELAIGINLRRGRRDLDCGCMGFGAKKRISRALVWRNAALALASLGAGLAPVAVRGLDWVDAWTIVCGVAMLVLLYLTFEGLTDAAQRLPRRRTR